jgi:carboxypeptidase Q
LSFGNVVGELQQHYLRLRNLRNLRNLRISNVSESELAMRPVLVILAWIAVTRPGVAQTFPTDDPIIRQIWDEGMNRSQAMKLMQVLTDSIGPRLTGTPGIKRGNDWLVATYQQWGVSARNEQYGTWVGWRRGLSHIDLVQPRVRSLEGTMLAWSGGTGGKAVDAATVILPDVADSNGFKAWLPKAKGKYVLISFPQPTCRPDSSFKAFALPETFQKLQEERRRVNEAWQLRVTRTAPSLRELQLWLEAGGARGVVTSLWSNGWGVNKIFNARTRTIPTVDLSCEDYGLVYRLTENHQGPVLRITADAEFLGDNVPVFNTIGEIKGSINPEQFVMLSAHFDSWDGSSGATDNGTGTITMLEAMRILKQVYPNPKRTILVGHWSGEEQGLIGSRSFAEDHQEVVRGLQALFNQDNGTGRVVNFGSAGLANAGQYLAKWMSRLPNEIGRNITLQLPGTPAGGGSDNASFICYGAPGLGLGSLGWEYGTYTWHTNRDTYDKVVPDEIRNNAVLTAMLVYLASEEADQLPRDRRLMPPNPQNPGQSPEWPSCQKPARSFGEWTR